MAIVITQETLVAMLNTLAAVGGELNGAKVGLFTNDYVPVPTTTLDDLTPATYTGYALSSAVTWGTAFVDAGGIAQIVGSNKEFQPTDDAVPNTVYGYWLETGTSPDEILVFAERFQSPAYLVSHLNAIVIVPRFSLTQPS